MPKTTKGGSDKGRSAISGRFVTTKYAKDHPKTTVVERKPPPKPKPKPKGK